MLLGSESRANRPARSFVLPWTIALLLLPALAIGQDGAAVWMKDYRHIHKRQATACTAGEYGEALRESQEMLADYPTDGEALFFAAVAAAHLADEDMTAWLRRALDAGVPPERFLVGPPSWSQPFHDHVDLARMLNADTQLLAHGPALGDITDQSARIWLRTSQPARVTIRLFEQGPVAGDSGLPIQTRSLQALAEQDHCVTFHFEGLQTSTRYTYDMQIHGATVWTSPRYSFRTAPVPGSPTKLRFAFGGGAAYTPRFESMWETIRARDPDWMLQLGDNVYVDDPSNDIYHRYLYHRRQSQSGYRRLVRERPVYAIWDDHDFGTNDCEGGPQIDVPAWKPRVWEIFTENWPNPSFGGGREQPGCWFTASYGDIDFFFLDGRYYRTARPSNNETPTMLGAAQKRWLYDALQASDARIKFLVSPVPWIGGNSDKWTGFAEERAELFQYLTDQKISGVVLLSADRHRSDLLLTPRTDDYDLYEFMSSRLTNTHTHTQIGPDEGAVYSYNETCSFGLVEIDTRADDPSIEYQIVDIEGTTVYRVLLSASQLQAAP